MLTQLVESSDKPIPVSGDCTLPKLTGERAKAAWTLSWPRARRAFRRAWRLVRWKMVAIITFTLSSTLLVACLAIATLNVVLRRESTNVIEKQISTLVEASRSVTPAILDRAWSCAVQNVGDLKPLVRYAQGAFPQSRISLALNFRKGSPSLVPDGGLTNMGLPNWLPDTGFTGVVVDHGQLEIRNIAALEKGTCRVAAIFRMPLGSELAKRLSLGGSSDVIAVSPKQFYVGGLSHKILGMIEANFLPGSPRPASVVLNVRNWETGAMEHWTAFEVRTSYGRTFRDLATIGSQLANWVWLLAAISFVALLIDASALWICVRLSREIALAIDDVSGAAQQIAGGNFAWRTPLRSNDQIGELTGRFNEMAASLEQFQKQEVTRLEFETDLRMAQRIQEYLFPRQAPVVSGGPVAGRTLPARTVGGDLYDFFELGQKQLGVLCADVSGKGVSAALMMANLQAVAHAHVSAEQLVERLMQAAASWSAGAEHFDDTTVVVVAVKP